MPASAKKRHFGWRVEGSWKAGVQKRRQSCSQWIANKRAKSDRLHQTVLHSVALQEIVGVDVDVGENAALVAGSAAADILVAPVLV